jgi:DedD protein
MDKKTTRRIIGVLVMIAMVIIVLPLLVNGKPGLSSLPMAEVKAPPFPELQNETDPIPASMIAKNNAAKTVITSTGTKHAIKTETSFAASPLVTTALEAKEQIDKAQQAAISDDPKVSVPTAMADEKVYRIDSKGVVTPATEQGTIVKMAAAIMGASKKAPEVAAPAKVEAKAELKSKAKIEAKPEVKVEANVEAKSVKADLKPAAKATPATATVTSAPVTAKAAAVLTEKAPTVTATAKTTADNVDNLKQPAWAVQLGAFKSKDNAMRLANQLRQKGYKAFTRDVKRNNLTLVFVGPELKEALASTLVSRIQHDVKMHGVIVSYKPLEA